ncbi:MAG: winged helix-turn-helix transcriptional regulator [Thermotogaceae bacterium]|nr:winged helix-turn-helix transcriptional regulator [Thermotogaceae bacterium]
MDYNPIKYSLNWIGENISVNLEIDVLKALADNTRYEIIKLLLRREFCVRALSRRLCISESAVSQHLKVLRSAHLVKGHKKGYFTHYSVDRGKLKALSNRLAELCEESSDTLLSKNIAIVQEPIGGGLNSSGECG